MSELSELLSNIASEDLKVTKVTESREKSEFGCNPECNPNCEPCCVPRCSPNCSPCFPHGKCNPELFGK